MIGDDERQLDAALAGALAHPHPARGEAGHRIGEAPRPAVGEGGRRADDDRAGEIGLAAALQRRRLERAEIDALFLIELAEFLERAVDIDRLRIAGLADQRDHPLRLAERIGADEMRPLRKLRDGSKELCDLGAVVGVTEHRQREGRLGDEHVAGDRLEGAAGRVEAALVVARCDDAHAALLHGDLRRAEDMAGRMKGDRHVTHRHGLADRRRLRGTGEALAHSEAP